MTTAAPRQTARSLLSLIEMEGVMRPLGNIVTALARLRLPRECKSILFQNVLLTRFEKAMSGLQDAAGYHCWGAPIPVPSDQVSARTRGGHSWR